MKQVFYKGQPYEFEMIELKGIRHFQLYQKGVLMHSVEQSELDIKSIVSLILDAYYKNSHARTKAAVLQ